MLARQTGGQEAEPRNTRKIIQLWQLMTVVETGKSWGSLTGKPNLMVRLQAISNKTKRKKTTATKTKDKIKYLALQEQLLRLTSGAHMQTHKLPFT